MTETNQPRWPTIAALMMLGALPLGGCLQVASEECSFGLICPPGMACDEAHRQCVLEVQLTSCRGEPDGQLCSFTGAPPGVYRCDQQVCLGLDECGNGIVEPGEECEAATIGEQSCRDVGYVEPGRLGCDDQCLFDTTDCAPVCGNGAVEPGEDCDDENTADGDGCDALCHIEACVVFVDADPAIQSRDGRRWATAYGSLQDAIDDPVAVEAGCEIWVAAGTYHVYQSARSDTVSLRPQVALYGGFTGQEYLREQRDWLANPTLLEGASAADPSLRVLHVVTGASGALLDGFSVLHGRADGADVDRLGGGVLNVDVVDMVISNCRIAECEAQSGGGLANLRSSPTITGCIFQDNAAVERGGGIANIEGSAPLVEDCELRDNQANEGGGFAGWDSAEPVFRRCRIHSNTANYLGGGAYNNAPLWLEECTFENNTANSGGGMCNMGDADPTVVNRSVFAGNSVTTFGAGMHNDGCAPTITASTFSGNQLAQLGGGIYNGNAEPQIEGCLFRANGANRGGAIYSDLSRPDISNTVFWENWSLYYGAALSSFRTTVVTVVNSTFFANDCPTTGGVIFGRSGAHTNLVNCVVWGNSSPVFSYDGGTASATYSIVQGGATGAGNLGDDPLLTDATSGDFSLLPGSPAIDSADGAFAPPQDGAGASRCDDPATPDTGVGALPYADRGAFEYQAAGCE